MVGVLWGKYGGSFLERKRGRGWVSGGGGRVCGASVGVIWGKFGGMRFSFMHTKIVSIRRRIESASSMFFRKECSSVHRNTIASTLSRCNLKKSGIKPKRTTLFILLEVIFFSDVLICSVKHLRCFHNKGENATICPLLLA